MSNSLIEFSRQGLINVKGNFSESCLMDLGGGSLKSLKEGKLKIHVVRHGGVKPVENLSLTFGDAVGDFQIYVAGDDSSVVVSSGVKGGFNIRLWRASSVFIGEKTTSNNAKIVCDNSTFECGSDCMFSDDVIFQTADQHAIIDLRSKKISNYSGGCGWHVANHLIFLA